MRKTFIDTSAFKALADANDIYHLESVGIFDKIKKYNYHLFTTTYVLSEIITLLRKYIGHRETVSFTKYIRNDPVITFLNVSEEAIEKALNIFEKYDDKYFSFVDCLSFVVYFDNNIQEVFAFDEHFNQMEFKIIHL